VVAIKIIKNKSMFAKQAKTEIRILEKIKENDPDDVIDCGNIFFLKKTKKKLKLKVN